MKSKTIYAQVLLLNGQIEQYSIDNNRKYVTGDFKAFWKLQWYANYIMRTKAFTPDNVTIPDGSMSPAMFSICLLPIGSISGNMPKILDLQK